MKRFYDKVNKTEDCWLWTAKINRSGYGTFKINYKSVSAHKFSYLLHFGGVVPKGMAVSHSCKNRKCVNPSHLFITKYNQVNKGELINENLDILCSYGCGKKAKYYFKNGIKYCCEEYSNSCSRKRLDFQNMEIITLTPEKEAVRRNKISKTVKINKLSGGLRIGSGRGKKGRYKGYWCDSSWELAWVIYNLDHNISFERNNISFEYKYKGQNRKYFPDFLIGETYYEVKGRRNFQGLDDENKEKIRQFPKKIVVLYSNEMKPYLEYVVNKYGKDFVKLYENVPNSIP